MPIKRVDGKSNCIGCYMYRHHINPTTSMTFYYCISEKSRMVDSEVFQDYISFVYPIIHDPTVKPLHCSLPERWED